MWFLLCMQALSFVSIFLYRHIITNNQFNFPLKDAEQYLNKVFSGTPKAKVICTPNQSCLVNDTIYLNLYDAYSKQGDFVILHEFAHLYYNDLSMRCWSIGSVAVVSLYVTYLYELSWWQSYLVSWIFSISVIISVAWDTELRADRFAAELIGTQEAEQFFNHIAEREHFLNYLTHPPSIWRRAAIKKLANPSAKIYKMSDFRNNLAVAEICSELKFGPDFENEIIYCAHGEIVQLKHCGSVDTHNYEIKQVPIAKTQIYQFHQMVQDTENYILNNNATLKLLDTICDEKLSKCCVLLCNGYIISIGTQHEMNKKLNEFNTNELIEPYLKNDVIHHV